MRKGAATLKLRGKHTILRCTILGIIILICLYASNQQPDEPERTKNINHSNAVSVDPVPVTDEVVPIANWEIIDLGPTVPSTTWNKILQVTSNIDLGEGTTVRAAAKVQMQEVMFGGAMGRKFVHVIDHSEQLTIASGQEQELVMNYIKGTVQTDHRLQMSYNGYINYIKNVDAKHQSFHGSGFIQAL